MFAALAPFAPQIAGGALGLLRSFFGGRRQDRRDERYMDHEKYLQDQRLGYERGRDQMDADRHNWMYGSSIAGPGQTAGGQYNQMLGDDYYQDIYGDSGSEEDDEFDWLRYS